MKSEDFRKQTYYFAWPNKTEHHTTSIMYFSQVMMCQEVLGDKNKDDYKLKVEIPTAVLEQLEQLAWEGKMTISKVLILCQYNKWFWPLNKNCIL